MPTKAAGGKGEKVMTSFTQSLFIVIAAAITTAAVRYLPFILFDHGKQPPKWINYLGDVLPPALMSVLIIYCLRNVNLFAGSHGIPELLCIGIAVILHIWRGNVLLSICVSTVLYMILVQTVF